MGFGFLPVTVCAEVALDPPVDVFVHWNKMHMEGFRSLKEGEAVEFTFKNSAKGREPIRVTGPGGVFGVGRERQPKGKGMQKRRSKGNRCYNWRYRPSHQGMQAATPAQEVPEYQPYGGLRPTEGPAGPQLTGKASLLLG